MTLGENIWAQSVRQIDWWKLDEETLRGLGKIVIATIDANFADIKRDHDAEIAEMERQQNESMSYLTFAGYQP